MSIWDTIFQSVVVPEVTRFIKAKLAAGEPFPSDTEIVATLNRDADGVIANGIAFLASKGQS